MAVEETLTRQVYRLLLRLETQKPGDFAQVVDHKSGIYVLAVTGLSVDEMNALELAYTNICDARVADDE